MYISIVVSQRIASRNFLIISDTSPPFRRLLRLAQSTILWTLSPITWVWTASLTNSIFSIDLFQNSFKSYGLMHKVCSLFLVSFGRSWRTWLPACCCSSGSAAISTPTSLSLQNWSSESIVNLGHIEDVFAPFLGWVAEGLRTGLLWKVIWAGEWWIFVMQRVITWTPEKMSRILSNI